jgi:hypothetical protein
MIYDLLRVKKAVSGAKGINLKVQFTFLCNRQNIFLFAHKNGFDTTSERE